MDVLSDPQMITKHKGFTEKMEWQEYEAEIEKELDKQALRDEIKKEDAANVNNKS